ncbi:MAG: hypothetical protein PHW19_11095 [Salinivirgaceae bacterium]|nr:hypothetical protein [Salinivirgaceae bacterium]
MSKKTILVLLHLPVWIIALLVAYFFSSDDVPIDNTTYVLFSTIDLAVLFLVSFYTFYFYFVPRFLANAKYKAFFLFSFIFVFILMPIFGLALILVTNVGFLSFTEHFSTKIISPWIGCSFITLICGLLGLLYRFSFDWFNNIVTKGKRKK